MEADESYFGSKGKVKGEGSRNKVPVFGILERNGKVKVETVKTEILLKERIKKSKEEASYYIHRQVQKMRWSCDVWF